MDSPLSEPDSLSSPGATTEPLPGTDSEGDDAQLSSSSPAPARRSRSQSLHAPAIVATDAGGGGGGGAESDSSLTEQSDSEVDPSAEDEMDRDGLDEGEEDEESEEAAGGAASELGDDEQEDDEEEDDIEDDDDDEPVQATPRGNKRPRPAVPGDEEDDEEDDELAHRARKRVGADTAGDDDDDLSSVTDDGTGPTNMSASSLPAPRAGPLGDASAPSSSTSTVGASARPRPAVGAAPDLAGDSLSELEDDDTDEPLASRLAHKPCNATVADASAEDEAPSPTGDDEPASRISSKGKKGPRGRGNGRPRGLGARGRARNAVARPATVRSESPLSAVESFEGAEDKPDVVMADGSLLDDNDDDDDDDDDDDASQVGGKVVSGAAVTEQDAAAAAAKELEDEANAVETLAAAAMGTDGSALGMREAARGRSKVQGRGKGKGAVKAGGATMQGSQSDESSGDGSRHFVNGTSPSNPVFSSLPALPAPSGLVELETAPGAVASQLAELAAAEADVAAHAAGVLASGSGTRSVGEGVAAPMDGLEEDESQQTSRTPQADGDHPDAEAGIEEQEEVEEERRPAQALSSKKGAFGRKGGKKGKGKEKVAPNATEDGHGEDDDAADGDEEEDTSDDAFMRKRAEAMEALTKIEISFARLRDLLYLERLADIEKERLAIENGAHPELVHLTQLIELRRNRKLELARLWREGLETAYEIQIVEREHANWNSWQDDRARERTRMLDEANSKRRRLEREKRALERPKDDSLASLLAPRPPPVVPLQHRRRVGFDAEPLDDREIAWSLRHPDVRVDASVQGLDDESLYGDLERMGLREPVRHPLYPYDAVYGHAGGGSFADSRGTHLGFPYGGGYDGATHAIQQHQGYGAAFGSLPPLPQHQRVESGPPHPPSNPRLAQGFPAELGGGQPGYPATSRAHGSGSYPQTYAEIEAWQQQQQQQQHHNHHHHHHHGRHGAVDDDRRRRTISASGSLGPPQRHESLDSIAAHRQNGHAAAPPAGPAHDVESMGGRTTPTNASAAAKARFTLDEHMSTRSPKGPASTSSAASSASKAPASSASATAARSPAFMAIPTIPPFDRNRHEQTIRARAAAAAAGSGGRSSPAPPVLPPLKQHPTPTSAPIGGHAASQQQQKQGATGQVQGQAPYPAFAVPQRAG